MNSNGIRYEIDYAISNYSNKIGDYINSVSIKN